MAHLLGSKNCLESLARDIEDIQTTIKDAIEKIGPLRVQSWKFPDKLSAELDIEDLTDTYSFSKDEDFNRLAHIVLFELVIDRFVFLLQASSQFMDTTSSSKINLASSVTRPKSRTVGTTMSVGLVVKKFWSRVVQTSHNIQQLKHEMRSKVDLIPKMEETIVTLREDNNLMRDTISSMRCKSSRAEDRKTHGKSYRSNANFILSPSSSISFTADNDTNSLQDVTLSIEDAALSKVLTNVSTQTFDTAFVPCEACSRTQQNLLDVGASVIALCESQGLPSSLAKQKKLLKQSLMAATDVSRWTNEQTRDIERINKHLDNLYAQIDPLKSELDKSRTHNLSLQEQIKELLSEKEETELKIVKTESEHCEKVQILKEDSEAVVTKLNERLGELESNKAILVGRCKQLQNENASRKSENDQIAKENKRMACDLEVESTENTRLKEVEKEFHILKEDLNFVRTKLYDTEIELGKSQAENKAISKHDKALQAKQESLLLRADELDQECEDLQNRIQEMEEEQDKLREEYETIKQEKELSDEEVIKLRKSISDASEENQSLEKLIVGLEAKVSELKGDLDASNKKLRLVSQFPVIGYEHKTINETADNSLSRFLSENGSTEIAKIVEANNMRIAILEEQNDQLRKRLESYKQFQTHKTTYIPKDRVPLWKEKEINKHHESHPRRFMQEEQRSIRQELHAGDMTEPSTKLGQSPSHRNEAPSSPKPPSHPRPVSSKLNEKRQAFAVGAAIANTGKLRPSPFDSHENNSLHRNNRINKNQSNDNGYVRNEADWSETYSCPDCDKMYSNKRDLQIHTSFCYAKI